MEVAVIRANKTDKYSFIGGGIAARQHIPDALNASSVSVTRNYTISDDKSACRTRI